MILSPSTTLIAVIDYPQDLAPDILAETDFDREGEHGELFEEFHYIIGNNNHVTYRLLFIEDETFGCTPSSETPGMIPFEMKGAPDRRRKFVPLRLSKSCLEVQRCG